MTAVLRIHGPIRLKELANLLTKLAEQYQPRAVGNTSYTSGGRSYVPFVKADGADFIIEFIEKDNR